MKKQILSIAAILCVAIVMTSCKDNKKEATTTEEKEVAEVDATAVDYKVNTEKSTIMWKGEKPTGTHYGTIDLSEGIVAVNNGAVEGGKFTIDMTSIVSLDLEGKGKESLESHLMGTVEGKEGDFFNVNKYPTATFELTGISEKEGKTMVSGNLTIKDKTNNIEFPAAVSFTGNEMSLLSEEFAIDRTKWDVNYGSKSVFDNLGDKFINDDMEIQIELYATKS
ncbi:YceI family protein [Patiriisocius hiemis]|uniref:YceI family protein n=1 Tax=Patiriisocius hiemis TaxID=3075604 RepID=A0ABU2YFH1_9FLAO|nr:YceI family protein [Constantimarinum sp. W242]MDT0556767.1 YceI family protein [Constantimarinum sp. W242]